MSKVTDLIAYCSFCDWFGTIGEAEPDVDGDGGIGCPDCYDMAGYAHIVAVLPDQAFKDN